MPKSLLKELLCCFGNSDVSPQPKPRKHTGNSLSPRRLSYSDISNSPSLLSPEDLSISLIGSNLHVFTLQELKLVTNGFSTSQFIGEGGFGPVYKGFIDDKLKPGLKAQPVAVKLLDQDGAQGPKEWQVIAQKKLLLKDSTLISMISFYS